MAKLGERTGSPAAWTGVGASKFSRVIQFGVVVVPFAYAIASGAIVASRAIGGPSELRALFDEAHQILASKEAAEPAMEPVTEGVR